MKKERGEARPHPSQPQKGSYLPDSYCKLLLEKVKPNLTEN